MTELAKKPSGRPVRQPVGYRNRLTVSQQDPNFNYRWVNTGFNADRVGMFEEAAYEIVDLSKHKIGNTRVNVGSSVDNTLSVGGGDKAVLMRIPKEFYDEDQRTKQAHLDTIESGVQKPSLEGAYGQIEKDVTRR